MRKATALFALALLAASPRAFGQDLVPPKLEKSAEPAYATAVTEKATVVLLLTIDKTGKVTEAVVTQSAGESLDQAAVEAAQKLEFSPATRDGQPIPAKIPFTFTFSPAPAPAPAPAPDSSSAPPPPTPPPPPPPVDAGASPLVDTPVEIAVEGKKPPRETTKVVLDTAEIRKLPGTGGDALRAIEAMPGVARPPGTSGLLIVRGAGPRDTLVFVDGTWIPQAYHFGGITSVIPTDALERIDFYPGNYSAEFGRGLGGMIDIGLRSPRKDRWGGMAQLDILDGRVLAEGPLSSDTRVLVSVRRSWVDAWIDPFLAMGGQSVRTSPRYWDGQAVLEHDFGSKTKGRVAFIGSDDKMVLFIDTPQADPAFSGNFGQSERFWRLQGRLDTRFSDDTRWVSMVSFGKDIESVAIGSSHIDDTIETLQARSDFRTRLAKGITAIVGMDTMWLAYDVTMKFPAVAGEDPTGPFFGRPAREVSSSGKSLRPAGYAMLDLSPLPGLKFLPGVRVDYTPDTRRVDVDPRFGVRFDVVKGTPRTTLKGAIGVYHQPPLQESVAPWGGSWVKSPVAYQTSLGVEQTFDERVELSVEGFYKQLRDLIVQTEDQTKPAGIANVNSGSGRVFGLETLLRYKPGGRFFGWIAYTLSRSERREVAGQPLHLFQWDQTHILSIVGSYDLGRGWSLGAKFRYTSGTPDTPYTGALVDADAGAYEPTLGRAYSGRTGAFHELSIRGEKTWTVGPLKLGAYLDVRNVYNRKNPEGVVYSYDYAKSAPVSGLPILPVVGLRGEL